ncbi:MAG: zinc carboxypeptidase [Bacteroidetes bacterium]|nr:MAG: zinc carboxypeptidase [Bacteroidota bacterium]
MIKHIILFAALITFFNASSQKVMSPEEFFGYPLGSYFTRHHQVINYFRQIERNSGGKMYVEEYGITNERRELVVAYISSPENISRRDEIQAKHEKGENEDVAIVWLSYNVHGNESAGTEASMQTAYELITEHDEWLKNVLIIIDPCINPDGRDRYVNWYNQQHNAIPNPNVVAAEHDEPWPSGRPNHYLFDLNRDWAWMTQVETRQRIPLYNEWLPHVHVDFHEQGIDDPYYFAPAAEPFHEVITDWQREFQNGLGRNHAKYFDKNGWFYFTREIFDLLYPSYGDTYPTYNGAIGMTYEQGGSGQCGLAAINEEGDTLTLYDRIAHHHTTGISTVEFSFMNRDKLISEFKAFGTKNNFKYKSYVLSGNPEQLNALVKLLDAHGIKYQQGNGESVKGFDFETQKSGSAKASEKHLIVSTDQKKGTLINVLFEPKTKLSDSLTYDITAWSLPYAYGLSCIASESLIKGATFKTTENEVAHPKDTYAYLFRWNSMSDAKLLANLISLGVKVRFSEQKFTFGKEEYLPGTLIVVKPENDHLEIDRIIKDMAKKHKVEYTISFTGMVDTGKDFGSSSVKLIDGSTVGLVSGEGTSSLMVGEVWYYFEQELNYPLTVIQSSSISDYALKGIDVLILPEGYYSISSSVLSSFISKGGKVIAMGGALSNFAGQEGYSVKMKDEEEDEEEEEEEDRHEHQHIAYEAEEREAIKDMITGAIYKCKVENSNPLAFGYPQHYFTLRLDASAYEWLEDGGNVVYTEANSSAVSGFVGCNVKEKQSESLIFGVESIGAGSVVYMVDNPLFRGFWENGKLFFANAIFFVNK